MKKMRKGLLLFVMVAALALCGILTACAKPKIVELDKATAIVEVGSTITLKGTVDGVDASEIVWASDKTAIATVSKGVVKGVSAGEATITATIGESVAKCVVTVKPVVTITVEPSAITLAEGKTATLVPTIAGTEGSASWKSDKTTVATVSDSGLVTAVSAGTATITATIGGKTATCVVTVQAVTITLDKSTLALFDDTVTATLIATAVNNSEEVVWASSDAAIATVSSLGVVTPVSAGSATITASANGKSAECVVTVSAVTITVDETATIFMTKTKQLTANIGDYVGAITWSSDNANIATVVDGLVTPVAAGSATITASVAGKTDTCAVTVKAVPTITLNKQSVKLDFSGITDSKTATVSVTVSGETAPSIIWTSSSNSVATVADGVITARGAGTAEITADFNGFTAKCDAVIKDYTGYTLIQTPNQFKNIAKNSNGNYVLGNNIDFGAKHLDCIGDLNGILDGNGYSVSNFIIGATSAEDFKVEEGKLWDNPLTWQGLFSNNYGTIKNIGFTNAIGYFAGNFCGIIAQVNKGTIENVLLDAEINFLNGSQNIGGIASSNEASGKITNCIVIASSAMGHKGLADQGSATDKWGKVSQGMIVGQFASGEIKNCYTASKPTTYAPNALFGGNMVGLGRSATTPNDPDYKQLAEGNKCANKTLDELKAAALFADSWNKNIWNIVDTELPTLKNDGKIAPTIVEFLDNNGKFINNELIVKAVVNTADSIKYSSSDTAVATVDENTGVVKAVSVGAVTITATAGAKTATTEIAVNLVWNSLEAKRLKEGARETLTYTALTDAVITWKSSDDNIALVEGGTVVAVGDGNVTIIAKVNDVEVILNTLSCFTVKISLDKTTGDVFIGKTVTLIATKQETTETIVWDSSDKLVATVSNSGVVTGIKVGFTNITATVEGKVATCRLEVKAEPKFKLNKSASDLYIVDGTCETLALSVIPDVAGETITPAWTSSDIKVATVDATTGVVTAVAIGEVKIRATVNEIYYKEATIKVIAAKSIDTAEKFLAIKKAPNGNYVLTKDIDFKNVFISDLGEFKGILDGRGHKIHNFTLGKATLPEWFALKRFDWDGAASSCGIFSQNFGTIKNMSITNVVSFVGYYYGIISSNNYGTIENILVESEFYSHADTLRDVGGISGTNGTRDGKTGIIRNCVVKLTAKSHAAMAKWIKELVPDATDDAVKYHGFTIGCLDGGIPAYGAYVQGLVVGLINAGTVENCYATTTRIWDTGETPTNADIFGGNLFGTSSKLKPATCVKKEVSQLTSAALFGDSWDKNVWNIVEGSQPTLKLC